MSTTLMEEGDAMMGPEDLAQLRFTHHTDKAAYFLKVDNCYAPSPLLDIRSKFADSSPHTLVSSSSCSSHRNSPDETPPQYHDEAAGSNSVQRNSSLHYQSDSPVSSHRSEDDHDLGGPGGEQLGHPDQTRVKRRKQNKPLKYDTDQQPAGDRNGLQQQQQQQQQEDVAARTHDTADTRVKQEDTRPSDDVDRGSVTTSIPSPPETASSLPRRPSFNGRHFPTGPTGVQIFNTDAYCYLCNREFCNKYFLKTHKANKHGVYDTSDSVGSPDERPVGMDGGGHGDGGSLSSPRPTGRQSVDEPLRGVVGEAFGGDGSFLPSSLFHPESSPLSSGLSQDSKSDSKDTAHSKNSAQLDSDNMQLLLQQRFLQMYAQNMALRQMQMFQNPNVPVAALFPGMLQFPPAGLNLLNFFPPQAPLMPGWPLDGISNGLRQENSASPAGHSSPVNPSSCSTERANLSDDHTCHVCQQKLSSLNFLKIHLRKKHGVEEDFGRPKGKGRSGMDGGRMKNSGQETSRGYPAGNYDASGSSTPTTSHSEHTGGRLENSRADGTVIPLPLKKRRRSKKKTLLLERQLMKESRESTRPDSVDSHQSAVHSHSSPAASQKYRFHADSPLTRPFVGMPSAHPPQFSNLQRLLQDSLRDNGNGRRETYRCSECLMDFANLHYLQCHYRNSHFLSAGGATSLPSPFTVLPDESAVLDLSIPKSRSRRTGDSQAAPFSASLNFASPPKTHSPKKRSLISPNVKKEEPEDGENGYLEEGVVVGGGGGGQDLETYCTKCSRNYCSKYFLKTHLMKEHQMTVEQYHEEVRLVYPQVWQAYTTPPDGLDATGSAQVTSTSRRNWCRYCKKDFCNKYFFKTHMEKMHNETVSLEAGHRSSKKRSKGAPCDICNKVLCSKYFLRIHKRKSHGIIDPLDSNHASASPPSFVPSMSQLVLSEDGAGPNGTFADGDEDDQMEEDIRERDLSTPDDQTCRPSVITSCSSTGRHLDLSSPSSPRTPSVDMDDVDQEEHDSARQRSTSVDSSRSFVSRSPEDDPAEDHAFDLCRKEIPRSFGHF